MENGEDSSKWYPSILGDVQNGVQGWYRRLKIKDLPDIVVTLHQATQDEVDENTEAILGAVENEIDPIMMEGEEIVNEDSDDEDDLNFVTVIVDLYMRPGNDPDLSFAMVTSSIESAKIAAVGTAMKHASDLALTYTALTNTLMQFLSNGGDDLG